MRSLGSVVTVFAAVAGTAIGAAACAGTPAQMDAAALHAWAGKPWNKASLMNIAERRKQRRSQYMGVF